MLKVSDAFNSAFAAPDRELRARVTIGKTVYDSDDLTSINYDSGAMTGEQFSIGSTYMNSTKITFSHLVEGLKQLDEVLVEFGVLKPDGAVEYVKMGTFIVDDKIQMDRNNNTTTIECMDRMTMLGGAYVSKLTYPARIKDVAVEIANMAGVKANETSFARLSENKINQPTGYTYRDAIGLIAQFQMGFALFDRDGLLDIRTLQDNSFKIDPNQYFLKGLVKNETFFKLNGISCTVVTTSKDENGNETSKTTVLQSGSSSGAQIKLANNVMTQDVLDRMYEALKFTNYYPFSLNWNGNPAVEAGDWLTVEDLQGNEFKVPNMSYTLTYNGGLTATSKADTSVSSPATYSYGGTISNIVNEIGGRESAEGNHIYEGTEDQEPTLSKEGDLWYKHVGPDTEEWIYKDGKWEFLTSTKTANDAADAADKASKEAEEAKNQANKAVNGANDAVAKAGFATDTATQAKSDAAEAGQQAKDALTGAKKALTDSATAIKDAADSLTSAKDAINKVGNLTTSVTSQFTTVDNELKSKVNQTDYDKLKGTVTSQQTDISQNANSIKLKADKSYADTINNSVVKNTSSVGLLNDQIALTVSKTELNNTLSSYATQTWAQSQINTTADSINLSVSKVQSNLDNLSIGARNYLADTGSPWQTQGYGVANQVSLNKWLFTFGAIKQAPFKDGEYVTVSFDYTSVGTGAYGTISPKFNDTPWGQFGDGEAMKNNGHVVRTVQWQSVWTTSGAATGIQIRMDNVATTRTVTVYNMQFERGNKDTDWKQAPEDMATEAQFSQLQVTVNGIQGTVQNKADQSQVTQLSGQITMVVESRDNLIRKPRFEDKSNGGWAGASYYNNPYAEPIVGTPHLLCSDKKDTLEKDNQLQVSPGETYYFEAWLSTFLSNFDVNFGFTITKTDGTTVWVSAIKVAKKKGLAKYYGSLVIPANSSTATPWIQIDGATNLGSVSGTGFRISKNAGASQITQLANDINLRVEKNKIVNQINISPESILIAGQKVHITGQTHIDNAVIKDAMIADIKADKITAGTLNAANVDVINLNANNITAGTIRGANLAINLNTGEVVFQHGRIHSTSNNVDVNIDKGYLSVANGNTRVLLKNGGIQFVQPTIFDERTNPYLSISNGGSGLAFSGARIVGRDYVVMANNANSSNIFDSPLGGVESFAGISAGYDGARWHPTKIGGADRGIILSAGKKLSSAISWVGNSASIRIGSNGSHGWRNNRIELVGEYVHSLSTYVKTNSSSPNVVVAADGALVRSTSASKYKTDIIRTNIPDYGEKLLNLPTATWTDIAETKRFRDDPTTQPEPTRNFGMIAEDLADAGLEMLVVRGLDGELEGINYDRIGPALIPVIAKLKNEVETLKQQLEEKTA
ncbi:gp58-like family protein [Latilactobacillus curvatus]|uniref:gp58-like family protein n=1 Tax=Latilactobacillus curvatus TaxID=28038 RepID=UPI002D771CA1|nr:gp58-like family protein [Latilactobacillus curvatus]WRS47072.1 gp58-like family protein [Latilactobacillus curvatus]